MRTDGRTNIQMFMYVCRVVMLHSVDRINSSALHAYHDEVCNSLISLDCIISERPYSYFFLIRCPPAATAVDRM